MRAMFCYAMMTAPMEISVLIDEGLEKHPEASWFKDIAERVLADAYQSPQHNSEMGLVITGQERVRELNRVYRKIDEPTDVLAFCMQPAAAEAGPDLLPFAMPPDGVRHLGEVIICYPQAVKQAEEGKHSIKREMAILIIHGVLHLLGYEHDTTKLERRMKEREAEILSHIEGGLN